MGKKSKRQRNKKKGGGRSSGVPTASSLPPHVPVEGMLDVLMLQNALSACSLSRLSAIYQDLEHIGGKTLDPNADRETMESTLIKFWPVGRFNQKYCEAMTRQLQKRGGFEPTFASGHKERRNESFAYTTGFTAMNHKELVIYNEHRSGINDKLFRHIHNYLRKTGKTIGHDEVFECEGEAVLYRFEAPDDVEVRTILIQ